MQPIRVRDGDGCRVRRAPEGTQAAFPFPNTMILPNAGDWASSAPVGKATAVDLPEPGDIVAWSHAYAHATGHVAIVSYPEPSDPTSVTLGAGEVGRIDVTMRRQVVEAGDDKVNESREKFWHFYDESNTKEVNRIFFHRLSK